MTEEKPLYLDPDQPIDARVKDLISRMTLQEKAFQMMSGAPAIERLGIPEYNWWSEALHGVARAGIATVFPQAIGSGGHVGQAADAPRSPTSSPPKARAKHQRGHPPRPARRLQGLTFWSPNINIFRDPRWGRGQETYGEDPFLTGRMGVAFVRGMQGDDPHVPQGRRHAPSTTRSTAGPRPCGTASTCTPASATCTRPTCRAFEAPRQGGQGRLGHERVQPRQRRTVLRLADPDPEDPARAVGLRRPRVQRLRRGLLRLPAPQDRRDRRGGRRPGRQRRLRPQLRRHLPAPGPRRTWA